MTPSAMIQVSTTELRQARRFLGRLRNEKNNTPELRHILGSVRNDDLTLVSASDDLRLEYRISNAGPDDMNTRLLIPAEALRDASAGGRRSLARMELDEDSGQPLLTVTVVDGTGESRRTYATVKADSFQDSPAINGASAVLPKETAEAVQRVAPFTSKDIARRAPICGVHFSPSEGGKVIATDGKQLAVIPAKVPDKPFLLPNSAVQVLGHQTFGNGDVNFIHCGEGWVGFRSGNLAIFTKTTAGRFPDYRQVIPSRFEASAAIPASHIQSLVAWLHSLKGASACVQLSWDKPNHLALTEQNAKGAAATTFELPVVLEGRPSAAFFKPCHLANALAIGRTIRFSGQGMPCLVTGSAGEMCAIMPLRSLPGD